MLSSLKKLAIYSKNSINVVSCAHLYRLNHFTYYNNVNSYSYNIVNRSIVPTQAFFDGRVRNVECL